jgi:mono/diheme cytochrome c family protein
MSSGRRSRTLAVVAIGLLAAGTAVAAASRDPAASAAPAGSGATAAIDQADPFALMKSRCSKCHNSEDWAGGIAFETMTPAEIAADAEIWEKAVRKLRGRLMPPPGHPQPDQQTIDAFVAWMESRLDQAAAGQEAPGSVGIHRLNRTEYAREIKQILDLDVEVGTLLPRDVSSDGFDNIAASLRTSPAFLDQYITAARPPQRQAEQPGIPRRRREPVRPYRRAAAGHPRRHVGEPLFPGRR